MITGHAPLLITFAFNRVFSSIDQFGRYAYGNQIPVAKWNLGRLASCLIPFIHDDEKQAVSIVEDSINSYSHIYEEKWMQTMIKKFGLFSLQDRDQVIINDWLLYLEDEDLDFTLSFRKLSESSSGFKETLRFKGFLSRWQERLENQPSRSSRSQRSYE